MKHSLLSPLVAGLLLLTGCSQPAARAGGTIEAINHTRWAINHFSVDDAAASSVYAHRQRLWLARYARRRAFRARTRLR